MGKHQMGKDPAKTPAQTTRQHNAALRKILMRAPFYSDHNDCSDPRPGPEEIGVLRRVLANDHEDALWMDRACLRPDTNECNYAIEWYWAKRTEYPRQWDGPVTRLVTRGAITFGRCAGGATIMVATPPMLAAAKKAGVLVGDHWDGPVPIVEAARAHLVVSRRLR